MPSFPLLSMVSCVPDFQSRLTPGHTSGPLCSQNVRFHSLDIPQRAVDTCAALPRYCRRAMNAPANRYLAVVDDDESVCRSLCRLLRTAGFHPVPFYSAEQFLADRDRPHFECLILDVQLDGISGIELWHRLVAVGDTTPVVFITAHDNAASRREAQVCGCAGYFRKTDPGHTILNAIRHTMDASRT